MAGFFETDFPKAHVYVGTRAGGPIKTSLENATKSIDVLVPYLTRNFLEILLRKQREGVSVTLVTSTECHSNPQERRAIFQMLTEQKRHEVPGARGKAARFRLYSLFLLLLAGVSAYAQASRQLLPNMPGVYVFAGVCAVASFLLFNEAGNMRLYTYSYIPRINFTAYVPWASGRGNDCVFAHAKVFVVDERLVHLGSVNLTAAGFVHNIEVRTDLSDSTAGRHTANQIRAMIEQPWGRIMNPGQVGQSVHAEPAR